MIPKNLEECFKLLIKENCNRDLCEFTSKKEDKNGFVGYHFSTGMQMRNNWGLWKSGNKLVKYFNKLGIYHADDMSGIILTSFHRYLNKKSIQLEKQIKFYINYWKELGFKNGNPTDESKNNYKPLYQGE
jgi:hypothetical protein